MGPGERKPGNSYAVGVMWQPPSREVGEFLTLRDIELLIEERVNRARAGWQAELLREQADAWDEGYAYAMTQVAVGRA